METREAQIPAVSAGDAITCVTELFTNAIRQKDIRRVPSIMFWGSMGVGKSQAVYEIAKQLSKNTGEEVQVTDIRLLQFSPVDFRGIPSADAERKFTVWLMPKLFDMDPEKIHILFLDEISAAPQSMQATAYQLALDRRIGEFALPEKCFVICAGNRVTDRSVAYHMPKALANRLLHMQVEANFDSWYSWALATGIDERVMGYLAFDNSKLVTETEMDELAFPTPRSWEFVSGLLKLTGKVPAALHTAIAGCVGVATALEFEAWCEVYRYLPPIADIFSGQCRKYPKKMDEMHALLNSMIAYIAQHKETISNEELENAGKYALKIPRVFADYTDAFFHGVLRIEEIKLRMVHIPAFSQWMKKE